MKKAGLYIRVSTLEQAQEGYSVGAQKERLIAFCKAHDWNIRNIYVDGGYTGANLDRPGIQKLISEIDDLDVVLVYKLDRLSRSQKDTLYLIEEVFLPHNVDFVSMNESFDTGTPFGRAMIGILSVFAQLEREQIKERTKMGKIARAKQGLRNGGRFLPIGYDISNGSLVINDYEAVQVRKIFDCYISGMSQSKIAKLLYSEGYSTRYGDWSKPSAITTVSSILTNDVYIGIAKYGDISVDNAHEPIISREQFDKAQLIRRKRREIYGDTAFVSKHLLTGMLFCARCGARYYAKMSGRYTYYVCYSRSKSTKCMRKADNCDNKWWRTETLEEAVEAQIRKVLFQEGYYDRLVSNPPKKRGRKPKALSEPEVISSKISDCDVQIEKLMDLFQSKTIPADVLSARIDKIYREKISLQEQLSKVKPPEPKRDFDETSVRDILSDLATIWDSAEQQDKRLILETLIDRIILDGDKIKIKWSFLPKN